MIKLEYEYLIGAGITDEEYRMMELVRMNTPDQMTGKDLAAIYRAAGPDTISALFSMTEERGRFIETIGELKRELSGLHKEKRRLEELRDIVLKAYEGWTGKRPHID